MLLSINLLFLKVLLVGIVLKSDAEVFQSFRALMVDVINSQLVHVFFNRTVSFVRVL